MAKSPQSISSNAVPNAIKAQMFLSIDGGFLFFKQWKIAAGFKIRIFAKGPGGP